MSHEGALGSNLCLLKASGETDLTIVYGTVAAADATQATTVATGLTSVKGCMVCLAEDPGAGAGDGASVSAVISSGNIIVDQHDDDSADATTNFKSFHWMAIGHA